jgi:hypothetical protein
MLLGFIFLNLLHHNIVVKPHGESSATPLTCRNIFTLNEVNYEALFRIGLELNVPVVKTYDLNKGNISFI